MGITINDFCKKAFRTFVDAGMTKEGAAGMCGNIYSESAGFYANRVEFLCLKRLKENGIKDSNGKDYTDATYTSEVDSGKITKARFLNPISGKSYGYGICQWTTATRKSGLYERTVEKGKSIADEDIQLEYVLYELKNNYKSVWNVLISTDSIKTASDKVLKDFESPANWSSLSSTRCDYSKQIYDALKSTTGGVFNVSNYNNYINSTGTHYISNSGHDENGGYTGGKTGDQTGEEWYLRSWYNRPWNCVLRYEKNSNVGQKLAELGCAAALNNKIGYNQGNRNTYWTQLQKVSYDPSKITTACDADCSAGVIANTKAVGYLLGIKALQNVAATYTGDMRTAYKVAGFTVLTDSKYLTSTDYLLPGDILLNDTHHTATNVTKGSKANSNATTTSSSLNETVKWEGIITDEATVRTYAGTSYKECSFSPLKKGAKVQVCDTVNSSKGAEWYYIKYDGKYGFTHSKFVSKSSYMVKVTASALNIRSGAGEQYDIVGCIRDKGTYTIIEESNGWGKLASGVGWISLEYTERV